MPNDAVLDPTVHHLFDKDRFNRGKSSRSWPLYPRCGHDLSPPRCPPFVEAGTPDLLWLYKSQRKAWKSGGNQRKNPESRGPKTRGKQGIEHSKKKANIQGKSTGNREGKTQKTEGDQKPEEEKLKLNPEAKPIGKTQKTGEQHSGIRRNRSRALAGHPSRLRLLNQRASQANKQGERARPREKQGESAQKQGSKTQKNKTERKPEV